MSINELFNYIEDYFISLSKDLKNNKIVLSIGMPKSWVLKSTNLISCDVIGSNDENQMVEIYGNDDGINIVNLLIFTYKLIDKNLTIEKAEKELYQKIEEQKAKLKSEIENNYQTLEKMKDEEFDLDDDLNLTVENKKTVESAVEEKLNRS